SNVDLVSPFDAQSLPQKLAQIETDYGQVTTDKISKLRDAALGLNTDSREFRTQLDAFDKSLQDAIEYFDTPPNHQQPWTATDIDVDASARRVTWPDGVAVPIESPVIRDHLDADT